MVNGILRKGTNQKGTDQKHFTNKPHCKCINFSREIIAAIYHIEQYAKATIFNIIIND